MKIEHSNATAPTVQRDPGIYLGISNEEYHASDAVSKSVLDRIAISPAHWKYGQRVETTAMVQGTALHCAVLEPAAFEARFYPQDAFKTQAAKVGAIEGVREMQAVAKQAGITGYSKLSSDELREVLRSATDVIFADEYIAQHAGDRTALNADDWEMCMRVRDAVQAHAAARALLGCGDPEVSAFWRDDEAGLLCRCRPDWAREDGVLVDVKKVRDASAWAFARAAHNYRYHVQAAWYLDGYSAASHSECTDFVFVAIEPVPPYAVATYELDPRALELGRNMARSGLRLFKECLETDCWPAYSEQIKTLDLPPYAYT